MNANKDDIVYHYCSIESFLSIIQNSRLWLSNVLKSNDAREYAWIRDKINIEIENRLTKLDISALESWKMGYQMGFDDDGLTVYTTSFSECKDSLSQWRGYAQDGQGVAIGFSKIHLQALNKKYLSAFDKVVYQEEEQARFIDTIVEENLEKMQYKGCGHAGLELNINYSLKFPLYKNPSFDEEKEWRIIFLPKPGGKGLATSIEGFQFLNTKFRIANGKIISYLEMDFSKIKHDVIKEIYIGPKSNASEADIKNVLLASGYDKPIRIIPSSSSYR